MVGGSGYYHQPTTMGATSGRVATVYFTTCLVKILQNSNRARASCGPVEARLVNLAEFKLG